MPTRRDTKKDTNKDKSKAKDRDTKKKVYSSKDFLDLSEIDPEETPDKGIFIKQKKNKITIEEEIQEFNIHELDINNVSPVSVNDDGAKLVVIASPNKGKSVLIKSILYAKKHIIPVVQTFSSTENTNHTFGKYCPKAFVNYELKDYVFSWNDYHKRQEIAMKFLENPWACRVEDDMSTNPKIFNSETYHDIFKNDRHRKSLYIMSLQYALDIRPAIRTCIDGTFILREANPKMRKTLLENFVPCLKNMSEFDAVMDEITKDFTSLYVSNKDQGTSMEDILFYYKADKKKADLLDEIKFGCNEYWHFSDQRAI